MPKLSDDNSADAVKRRAKMSAETRVEQKAQPGRTATADELAAFRKAHDLPEDAPVFLCRRGR